MSDNPQAANDKIPASVPLPGSREAIALSCTCPVADNHHGHGVCIDGVAHFWYSEDCPLHNPKGGKT